MQVDLKKILSLIDLTSLNDADTESVIDSLCHKAISAYGHVAAVCVYPQFAHQVAMFFSGKPVKVATVVNFPAGTGLLEDVERRIRHAIQEGAQEIDLVFPYQRYLSGDKTGAYEFIRACKEVCGETILLKVILETGVLSDIAAISEVSRGVLLAGADFLKTSTGKTSVGATVKAAQAMLEVIKELTPIIKRPLGFKASGGVRTIDQAVDYIALAGGIMGVDWVVPVHFRLGASQLLGEIFLAFPNVVC